MADAEQLALLKSGVEAWNAWRRADDEENADPSMADLSEANLTRPRLRVPDWGRGGAFSIVNGADRGVRGGYAALVHIHIGARTTEQKFWGAAGLRNLPAITHCDNCTYLGEFNP